MKIIDKIIHDNELDKGNGTRESCINIEIYIESLKEQIDILENNIKDKDREIEDMSLIISETKE